VASAFLAFLVFLTAPALADDFSDLSVGYRIGDQYREPGVTQPSASGAPVAAHIVKNVANVTYVDSTEHGTDFVLLDLYFSDSADPARDSHSGAFEPYFIYRHAFRISAWTGQAYGFGPVADTTFLVGTDLNYKDSAYNPRKRFFVAGPEFEFAVAKGFLKTAILVTREYDHNGILERTEDFDATWGIETSWARPFFLGTWEGAFEGYLDIYGPKGRDDFGNATHTEILFHPRVIFDLGARVGRPGVLWGGIGYEYWHDKFGVNHGQTPGAIQSTGLLELVAHI
jgi:nucleoside-specific outer membrane channel protein Tsx